ncbi:alkaline phosphatase family protein [Shewanella eurypsychrophilus]|uniref:Alkaline phosphatase family protein n=1 Tax=Shewanella eurypsychrophilus TaxID=2593656 RepID=A0ABX6VDB2_9GAMM|nr:MULTISPECIES: alkaline phosphatase family protein [Shewanella]QFU23272.1 alkaline phosphatase family protein [Shewanella sp. YLB-09]QPG58501.1 alkaline phosphatase family protein [Shewanella eurypsychrophilus]
MLNNSRFIRSAFISTIALSIVSSIPVFAADSNEPKLILQITVDALRGDLASRFLDNMGEGGFRYLLDNGIVYTNAHYQHANTETIVGHVSLATGATPSVHGMVGNVWFDRDKDRSVYNIEDGNYHLLTTGGGVDSSTEIDATQKVAKSDGRSPITILTSTISDEITTAYNGQSKVYSVSIKDRGAVSLAGEYGKAFWFSKATAGFVTSDYYFDKYPNWVEKWNKSSPTKQYHNKFWSPLKRNDQYFFASEQDTSYKLDFANFGERFPHPYGPSDDKYFTTKLTLSPAGDDLTLDFTKALISNENIGKNSVPDYLAISFSATDYVLHVYGPSSKEAEDNLLRLDRTLAKLFSYIDETIGLDNTLIVLSADHGAPDAPGHLHNLGGKKAHYFNLDTLKNSGAFSRLETKFGIGESLFKLYSHPYIYLDHPLIEMHKLDLKTVQLAVAKEVEKINGIEYAISSQSIAEGKLPNTRIMQQVTNNHHSQRSGDIYLIFSPNVYINDFDGLQVASVHGSPWRYDTHVPIIFAGAGLKGQTISREVAPYDIAPTISNYLGITYPSGATGTVLKEVVETE